MDKRFVCTVGALGAVVAVSLMLAKLSDREQVLPLREPVPDVEIEEVRPAPEEEEDAPAYAYLLREHEGYIGVFLPGEEEPDMMLDVAVRFLPDYDRMLMQEGIPARDYNHLVSLIEDYIS